jgi:Protein of unknown function (DUF1552)
MGIMPQFFFPEKAGADYAATQYIERLAAHRKQLTVFSGLSHPGVTGGHAAEKCFITGTPHPERGGFINKTLLDRTMVLNGTPMGSANSHDNSNLPVLLAGGGFKHGQHPAFDTKNNYPLANLYVSMLQRLGIEAGTFATSSGTMRGLPKA